MAAVRTLLESRPFDEIIVATQPAGGASRFLRMDLAHRLQRVTKLPVEEVAGEEPDAAETARLAELQFPGVPAAGAAGAPVRVLLVEDDEDDAELTRLALKRCPTPNDGRDRRRRRPGDRVAPDGGRVRRASTSCSST